MRTLAIYSEIFADWGLSIKIETTVIGYLRQHFGEYWLLGDIIGLIAQYSAMLGVNENIREIRDRVAKMSDKQPFLKEHYDDFEKLWADPYIQGTLEFRNRPGSYFQIMGNAQYLFEHMNEYWMEDYVPTFDDLLHFHRWTVGINKIKFALPSKEGANEEIYEVFDFGGFRNERRKWWHFFENTAAIIFVVSLSGYNELLWEDGATNRMQGTIDVFGTVVSLRLLRESPILLFFNNDRFEEKVGRNLVKEHFDDFEGNETKEEIIEFFKQKFLHQINEERQKQSVSFYVGSAIDTCCVQKMFDRCRIIIKTSKQLQIQELL